MKAHALWLVGALLIGLQPTSATAPEAAAPPEVFVGGGYLASVPADGCPPALFHVVLRPLEDRANAVAVVSAVPPTPVDGRPDCVLARATLFSPVGYATPGSGGHVQVGALLLSGSWETGWRFDDPATSWRVGAYGSGCGIPFTVKTDAVMLRGAAADLTRCGPIGLPVSAPPNP